MQAATKNISDVAILLDMIDIINKYNILCIYIYIYYKKECAINHFYKTVFFYCIVVGSGTC